MAERIAFTMDEVAEMVVLTSLLDPEKWTKPAAKAVINKAKHAVSDPKNGLSVVGEVRRG